MSEALGIAASGLAGAMGLGVALGLAWTFLDLFFRIVPVKVRATQDARTARVKLQVIHGGRRAPQTAA